MRAGNKEIKVTPSWNKLNYIDCLIRFRWINIKLILFSSSVQPDAIDETEIGFSEHYINSLFICNSAMHYFAAEDLEIWIKIWNKLKISKLCEKRKTLRKHYFNLYNDFYFIFTEEENHKLDWNRSRIRHYTDFSSSVFALSFT